MNPDDEMFDFDRNALEEAMITDHERRRVNQSLGNIQLDDTQDVLELPDFQFEAAVEHELAPHQVVPAPMGAEVEHAHQVNPAHMEARMEEARAPVAPAPHLAAARLEDLEMPKPNTYVYHSNPINQGTTDIWARLFYNPFSIGLDPRSVMTRYTHMFTTRAPEASAPPQLTHNNPSRARLDPRSVTRRSRITRTVTPCSKEERSQKIQKWRKKRRLLNYTNRIRYDTRRQQAERKPRVQGRFVPEMDATGRGTCSHPTEADYTKDHEIKKLNSAIHQLKQEIQRRDSIIHTLRRELELQHIATGQESRQAGIMHPSQPPNQQPHPPESLQHVEPAGEGPPATQDQRAKGGGDATSD